MKNIIKIFTLMTVLAIFSCEEKNEMNENAVDTVGKKTTQADAQPVKFIFGWKDHIVKDSSYLIKLIGNPDSLNSYVLNSSKGNCYQKDAGTYEISVTEKVDTLRIYINKHITRIVSEYSNEPVDQLTTIKTLVIPVTLK